MSFILVFLCCVSILLLSISQAAASENPGACSGVCNNSHDPAIVRRSDGNFFRFSTGGRIAIHTAPSISGPWTYRGAALPSGSRINLQGRMDLWAPDVTRIGNKYYLLYSVSTFGSQTSEIGYATSPSMDVGTWTDHGSSGVASTKAKPYNAIDGNLVEDNNRQLYMSFGSFWNGLFLTPMRVEGEALRRVGGDRQIAYQPAGDHAIEAPYIYKNNGTFYLFFSAGKCCGLDKSRPARGAEYRILACRSVGGATGPYVDRSNRPCTSGGGTPVLGSHGAFVYAPGGQGVYTDPQFGPVLYYHYIDTRIGFGDGQKKFGWNRINFQGGWPTV